MAAPDIKNVASGSALVTGAIFVAPTSVPLPTDGTSALPAGYECLGFTSDDGLVIHEESTNTSLRAWEGRAEIGNRKSDYTEQISFTPVECSAIVARTTWGDDAVTVESDGTLHARHHGKTMKPVHIVVETVPFDGAVARYCSISQLVERGDQTNNGEDFSGRELTFTNLTDSEGYTMHEYVAFTSGGNCELASLAVGTNTLNPTFSAATVSYGVETTNASDTILAAAADPDATIVIKNGSTTVTNGSTASWSAGDNTLTVTVTNGDSTKVYTVTVNKS